MSVDTKQVKFCRVGRFKVSLLEVTRTSKQPEFMRDYAPEREQVQHRVCVQYGKKVDGKWQNQTIWCSPEEFKSLANCIEDFNSGKEGVQGSGDVKSPKSDKVKLTAEEETLAGLTKKSASKKLNGDVKSPTNSVKGGVRR